MKVLILLGLGLFLSNLQAQTFHTDIRGTNDAIDGGMFQLATPSANHYLRLFSGRVGDPKPYLYFSGPDTFRIASGNSNFSSFTENMTLFNDYGSDGSTTTFVGIGNQQPKTELDIKTTSVDDGSEIRISNGDESHFLRFFSGRQNQFAYPTIYWKQGDSLSFGTNENIYTEKMRLLDDGTLFLNSNKGIALDLGDRPIITRGWDKFTSGPYAGIGRWGIFMEENYLTFGMPDINNRGFQFVSYNADGTVAQTQMRLKEGRLGINQSDPQHLLDVNGDVNIDGALFVDGDQGSAGQVLTSNGSGAPSWTDFNTNPQVGFKARLTSEVAVSTLTEVTLTSFTEYYDDGGNFNHTTGVFTAPSDGVFHFECMFSWTIGGMTQSDIPVIIRIKKNNALEEQFAQRVNIVGLIHADQHYSTDLKLLNGDQISFVAYQVGGSSMFISGMGGIEDTKVSGYRVY